MFCSDFEIDANEAEANGDNAVADEAIEDNADKAKKANEAD